MAEVLISDLSLKTIVDPLDELEIQEAGGGDSKKARAQDLFSFFIAARGRGDRNGGVEDGSVGIISGVRNATGVYEYTLAANVSATTTQVICTAHEDKHMAVGRMLGTDKVLIQTHNHNAGVLADADADHSFLVMT